jgi:hypothetical protein
MCSGVKFNNEQLTYKAVIFKYWIANSAYKIFNRANAYSSRLGKKNIFKIELAGVSDTVNFYRGFFTAKPHKHISTIAKTDLEVIPSLNHNYQQAIKVNL